MGFFCVKKKESMPFEVFQQYYLGYFLSNLLKYAVAISVSTGRHHQFLFGIERSVIYQKMKIVF